MDAAVERVFEQLQGAERDRRRVQFGYTDKNGARTQRRVDPYGFIVSNGRVYLVGYDHTRTDMRVFAVDNVLDVVVTPQTFEKPRRLQPRRVRRELGQRRVPHRHRRPR